MSLARAIPARFLFAQLNIKRLYPPTHPPNSQISAKRVDVPTLIFTPKRKIHQTKAKSIPDMPPAQVKVSLYTDPQTSIPFPIPIPFPFPFPAPCPLLLPPSPYHPLPSPSPICGSLTPVPHSPSKNLPPPDHPPEPQPPSNA